MNKKNQESYNPTLLEKNITTFWGKKGYFAKKTLTMEKYSIVLPPPNITGNIHMGHAFQHTIMDLLIRYNRMQGKDTLWQPGIDHAGIATQLIVEKQLRANNMTRQELGREKFIETIWLWKSKAEKIIKEQMKRLGSSLDWQREVFSLDSSISQAVSECFITLYEQGLIYKDKRLVNWDPTLLTAVSDLEVIKKDEKSHLWYIKYNFYKEDNFIIIATTRPETIFADVAIGVHPEDARFCNIIGKKVKIPLMEKYIPIITDKKVNREFGTGCLKITPAHDFEDYEIGKRNNLPVINIFTKEAKLNNVVPNKYINLCRFVAREEVIQDLQKSELLIKVIPHTSTISRGERSQAILEPYLTKQWFVKTTFLKDPAVKAVKTGEIKFIPKRWEKEYYSWMDNLQDWCISRQIWWGHKIPAWYDNKGNVYVAKDEITVRQKYNLSSEIILSQDPDVFDTWFSSSLWPFSTLGWPRNTVELEKYYPNSVIVTGFDIIFFWIARMIMLGIHFMKDVPFHNVYITGLICDKDGKKMSKSKGNVMDPIDLINGITLKELITKRTSNTVIEKKVKESVKKETLKEFPNGIRAYGADALRFAFTSTASHGKHVNFDTSHIVGHRNFCNKLWNASKLVMIISKDFRYTYDSKKIKSYHFIEQAILHELNETTEKIHSFIKNYKFDLMAKELYTFTWDKYCNWFLELSKNRLHDTHTSKKEKDEIKIVLILVFQTLLRLMHPVIPFITECIYQQIKHLTNDKHESILQTSFPTQNDRFINKKAEVKLQYLKGIINDIRTVRSKFDIKSSTTVNLYTNSLSYTEKEMLMPNVDIIKNATNTVINIDKEIQKNTSSVEINGLNMLILIDNYYDAQTEYKRLTKEILNIDKEINFLQKKINNDDFIRRAPARVILEKQEKLGKCQKIKRNLLEQSRKVNSSNKKINIENV